MSKKGINRRVWGLLALALVLIAAAGVAFAAEGQGQGKGKHHLDGGKGEGRREGGPGGEMRGRVLFGEISLKSDNEWTITPQLPPQMKERAAGRGLELPELPDSISFNVGPDTQFYFDGAEGSSRDFGSGDQVVVKLNKPWKEDGASAEAIADPQTARDYIMEKLREGRDKGGRGDGGPGGPGGPGGERKRPGFGVITAISADSITIRPEIPDFIKARMEERGRELPQLPDSLSGKLSSDTRYFKDSEEASLDDFKVGDKVAILAEGGRGGLSAIVVSDWASAEARMEKALQRGGGEGQGERRKGEGKGKGKPKGQGRGKDKAGCEKQ